MESQTIQRLPIGTLQCAQQVRTTFIDAALEGLAQTIRETGILQPLLVRRVGPSLVVLDGERRLRAAKLAGLTTVPVIVDEAEYSETAVIQRQLLCNLQREGLTPVERARALERLMRANDWTAGETARRVGLSEATVSRLTALLTLPPDVLAQVERGEIPASTAYQIAITKDAPTQSRLAAQAASGGLTREGVAKQTTRHHPVRHRRKPRRSVEPCCVVPLGGGRSIAFSGPDLTLQAISEWLQELLTRIHSLEPRDMELTQAVEALAAPVA